MTEFEMGYRPEQPTYKQDSAGGLNDETVSTDPELDVIIAALPAEVKTTFRAELLAELMHREPETAEAASGMLDNLLKTYQTVQDNEFAANTAQDKMPGSPTIQAVLLQRFGTRMGELATMPGVDENLVLRVQELLSPNEEE